MIKTVIFDCDGVLVDSRDANVAFYQALLVTAGYAKPRAEEVLECFHLPLRESIIKLTGKSDELEIHRITLFVHDKTLRHPELFHFPAELHETLSQLSKKYTLAIATSRITIGLTEVLEAGSIGDYFPVTVAKDEYTNPKPHPEPLLLALHRLNMSADEAIYIGDSHTDIEAARAAGMRSIHLASTVHKDADVGITHFSEIPAAVEQIVTNQLANNR